MVVQLYSSCVGNPKDLFSRVAAQIIESHFSSSGEMVQYRIETRYVMVELMPHLLRNIPGAYDTCILQHSCNITYSITMIRRPSSVIYTCYKVIQWEKLAKMTKLIVDLCF